MVFDRVNRLSVPEEIISSVKGKVLSGELKPGDKLPSENKMAEMFGVGRGTIREAMKVMIYLGLVERNNSRTAYITRTAKEKILLRNVLDSFEGHRDALEMIEVRKIIEPEAAALAAERKEGHVIEKLEKEYSIMEEESEDLENFIEHDNQFHHCIFSGTGNRIIIDLMESIHNAIRNSQSTVLEESMSIKPRSLRFHKEILEAIKRGNGQEAREVMLSHILDIEREMYKIFSEERDANEDEPGESVRESSEIASKK